MFSISIVIRIIAVLILASCCTALDKLFEHEWSNIDISEALNYYTAYELCQIIKQESYHHKGRDQTLKETCSKYPGNLGKCNAHAHPGVFLKYNKFISEEDDKDLIDLIKLMRNRGSNTLVLIGDSITEQHYDDCMCAVTRGGLNTRNIPFILGPKKRLSKEFVIDNLLPTSKLFDSKFHIIFVHMGELRAIGDVLKSNVVKGSAMIIFSGGLGFNTETEYQEFFKDRMGPQMRKVLTETNHVILFREHSAQHFPFSHDGRYVEELHNNRFYKSGGTSNETISLVTTKAAKLGLVQHSHKNEDIFDNKSNTNFLRCYAQNSWSSWHSQLWRNQIASNWIKEENNKRNNNNNNNNNRFVGIIPFYNISWARDDYSNGYLGDCTHYVPNAPLLWRPLYSYMYKAFDRPLESFR